MKHIISFVLSCYSFYICNGQINNFNINSLTRDPTTLDSISFSAGAISEYVESNYFLFSDSALIDGPNIKIRSNEMKVYYLKEDHPRQKFFTEAHICGIAYFFINKEQINLPIGYKKCILDLSNLNYIFLFE
ncbi:MAG TPA: hypothetical protein PKM27_09705 [Saprospiraceae bacterium]|nr:hypothetical protein [Saprospiraceae bacterium]HNT21463.1 hypothetical protein [Saprospiraceae bacterium]